MLLAFFMIAEPDTVDAQGDVMSSWAKILFGDPVRRLSVVQHRRAQCACPMSSIWQELNILQFSSQLQYGISRLLS